MAGFSSVDGRTPVDGDERERKNNYDAQAEAHPNAKQEITHALVCFRSDEEGDWLLQQGS
jgi:hypothetical protein